MRHIIAVLAVFAVSGCVQMIQPALDPPPGGWPASRIDVTQEIKVGATEAVKERLKDPDSARLKFIKAYRKPEGFVVCGLVNAKNSFGGYVGDRRFRASVTPLGDGQFASAGVVVDDSDRPVIFSRMFPECA